MTGLILVVGSLWLSERFGLFGAIYSKGWPVLAALAIVAAWAIVAVLGCIAGMIFRRRVQFSLRSLLLFIFTASITLGWFTAEMRRAQRQEAAILALTKANSLVYYTWEIDDSGARTAADKSPTPEWLENQLGPDFFASVEYVRLGNIDLGVDKPKSLGDPTCAKRTKSINEVRVNAIFQCLLDSGPKKLSLSYSKATDDTLEQLGQFTGLEELHLCSTKITDAGLQRLKNLPSLRALNLCQTDIGNEGLRNLAHCRQLRQLKLGWTCVSDEGLKYVGLLPQLRILFLDKTKITDAGIEHLQDLQQLEFLSLQQTRVTEACVVSLVKLRRLTTLAIPSGRMTASGLVILHESLPACEVLLTD